MKVPIVGAAPIRLPNGGLIRKHRTSAAVEQSVEPQKYIKAAYYRGGTSRGVMINPINLPTNHLLWPSIFQQVIGSPDRYGRQLDGMGAGISSLSKICLVEPTRKLGVPMGTIDYTFVGMGIKDGKIDVAGNCGNMLSAVGPFAHNEGLISKKYYAPNSLEVTVPIRNTNTGQIINSTFTAAEDAAVQGDCVIDGVAGSGSPITLEFLKPYGSKTGKLLPTGKTTQKIRGVEVSCIDGATPCVFVRAGDLGIDGNILPDDFMKRKDGLRHLNQLEAIRRAAAVEMGLASSENTVARTIPKIGIVKTPSPHRVLSGALIEESDVDMVVRFISDEQPHRAIPLTAALTTAIAARVRGSVVAEITEKGYSNAKNPGSSLIRIGHASGTIEVDAHVDRDRHEGVLVAKSASVWRTARRIFEGRLFYTGGGDANPGRRLETRLSHSLVMSSSTTPGTGERFLEYIRNQEAGMATKGSEDTARQAQDLTEEPTKRAVNPRRKNASTDRTKRESVRNDKARENVR